jgi:hypothetical protein
MVIDVIDVVDCVNTGVNDVPYVELTYTYVELLPSVIYCPFAEIAAELHVVDAFDIVIVLQDEPKFVDK